VAAGGAVITEPEIRSAHLQQRGTCLVPIAGPQEGLQCLSFGCRHGPIKIKVGSVQQVMTKTLPRAGLELMKGEPAHDIRAV
jgi:hypothetical protein